MSKDGAGGGSYGGYSSRTTVKQPEKNVFDLHIETLKVIDNQLKRLHDALNRGDGDDDVTQEQITQLQDELCRLSEQLGDVEVDLCNTLGNQ